jgi:hypothetical protein
MIEMHTEEPYDDAGSDAAAYPGLIGQLWRLVWSAPSLAIASLVLGLGSLTIIQAADEIGETALFSSTSGAPSNLTELRIAAGIRLVIACIGLVFASISAIRLLTGYLDDDDGEAGDDDDANGALVSGPLWVRAVAGAGFLTCLVAGLLSLASLVYALHATTPPSSGFG